MRERGHTADHGVLPGRKVLFAPPRFDRATVRYLRDLMESGQFRPVIARCYPLDQIVDAYRYVEAGQKPATLSSPSARR